MNGFTFDSSTGYGDATLRRALDQLAVIEGPLAGPLNALRISIEAVLRDRARVPMVDTDAIRSRGAQPDNDAATRRNLEYLTTCDITDSEAAMLLVAAECVTGGNPVPADLHGRVSKLAMHYRLLRADTRHQRKHAIGERG